MKNTLFVVFILIFLFGSIVLAKPFITPPGTVVLAFSACADMRQFTGKNPAWFRGLCEALREGGAGKLMITPGDADPPDRTWRTIQTFIGPDYLWYPAVGNHDAQQKQVMAWYRRYNHAGNTLPGIVNYGPLNCYETTYSFNQGPAHFVILNEYFDGKSDTGTNGTISEALYNWLIADLKQNKKPYVFVIGHEPAFPQPDTDNGYERNQHASLNRNPKARDRFWKALQDFQVTAYICGHTHSYSAKLIQNVWQIDVGHARGLADNNTQSTFVMVYLMADGKVWITPYRQRASTGEYEPTQIQQIR